MNFKKIFVLVLIIFLPTYAFAFFDVDLKYGSRGTAVVELQDFLKDQEIFFGDADGVFGSVTFRAVQIFQTKNRLRGDGYFGPGSRAKAKSLLSSPTKISNIPAMDEIRIRNFELLQAPREITFGEALEIANYVSELTKIRSAFLLAILQEELELEKFDMCYLTDLKTGEGLRITDNLIKPKTMHPTRDIPSFLKITKGLEKDPLNTPITCPMSFGYGGAMGPADFIPSTWMLYKKQIENITGKPADPWNIYDAFLAAGLFLRDAGAKSKTYSGEWKAAMIYFSGSANSPHHFYADGAMKIAEKIQKNIDIIQKK
jgi:hypothetical protein